MGYDLQRFVSAQDRDYKTALAEIQSGHKYAHWIWYIFPQIAGLGHSSTSKYYAIRDLDEAKAYMDEPTLRNRLIRISEALLSLNDDDAEDVMGRPDDMKLRSSMTLFSLTAPEEPVFQKVLDKFWAGEPDQKTIEIVENQAKVSGVGDDVFDLDVLFAEHERFIRQEKDGGHADRSYFTSNATDDT